MVGGSLNSAHLFSSLFTARFLQCFINYLVSLILFLHRISSWNYCLCAGINCQCLLHRSTTFRLRAQEKWSSQEHRVETRPVYGVLKQIGGASQREFASWRTSVSAGWHARLNHLAVVHSLTSCWLGWRTKVGGYSLLPEMPLYPPPPSLSHAALRRPYAKLHVRPHLWPKVLLPGRINTRYPGFISTIRRRFERQVMSGGYRVKR